MLPKEIERNVAALRMSIWNNHKGTGFSKMREMFTQFLESDRIVNAFDEWLYDTGGTPESKPFTGRLGMPTEGEYAEILYRETKKGSPDDQTHL